MEGIDQVFGNPARMTLGYTIGRPTAIPPGSPNAPDSTTSFGWSGVGGSHAGADTAAGIALAVCKNRFNSAGSSTDGQIADIVMRALGES
jgi:CubicO group peptidase (beta-lactamase class C family)